MKLCSRSKTSWVLTSVASLMLLGFTVACGDSGTSTSVDPTPVVQSTNQVTALADAPSAAFAGPPPNGDFEPPEALVEACADIDVGTACSFTGREGNAIAGTCSVGRGDSGVVLCRPNDRPDRGDRPSREERRELASAACSGLTDGNGCTIDFENRSVEGTCGMHPEGEGLFCIPNDRPNR